MYRFWWNLQAVHYRTSNHFLPSWPSQNNPSEHTVPYSTLSFDMSMFRCL